MWDIPVPMESARDLWVGIHGEDDELCGCFSVYIAMKTKHNHNHYHKDIFNHVS